MGLDSKTKSLIAVGASLTANCQPCIKFHMAKARENGADEQEISEAVEVGKAVRTGAASQMDKFTSGIISTDTATSCKAGVNSCCR
jgi:AhpD family alkylhydroperoxidase